MAGTWGIHEAFGYMGWQVQSGMKLCGNLCGIMAMWADS